MAARDEHLRARHRRHGLLDELHGVGKVRGEAPHHEHAARRWERRQWREERRGRCSLAALGRLDLARGPVPGEVLARHAHQRLAGLPAVHQRLHAVDNVR